MMKVLRSAILLFLCSVFTLQFIGCSKNETMPDEKQANSFVWKGMNAFYKWQSEIEDLSDKRFTSTKELDNYLKGFENSESLYETLIYKELDSLSSITENYYDLSNAFDGILKSNGMRFSLVKYKNNSSRCYGYVHYVVKNSDAQKKGIHRGTIFSLINGKTINTSNFSNLTTNDSFTITLADFNGGIPTDLKETVSLNASKIQELPILGSNIIEKNGVKIGYIALSKFIPKYDNSINNKFKSLSGANHLIVDLRYCNSGAIETSKYIASMITGQFKGKLFINENWNSKVLENVDITIRNSFFTNQINNSFTSKASINGLKLNTVYFLTAKQTSSAAEVLINSLKPYIDVKIIGSKTLGQNLCKTILFDSDDFNFNGKNFNNSHTIGLFPVVFDALNSEGKSFGKEGISPTIETYENPGKLGQIGDTSDPFLQKTIDYILTGKNTFKTNTEFKPVETSESRNIDYSIMHSNYKPLKN